MGLYSLITDIQFDRMLLKYRGAKLTLHNLHLYRTSVKKEMIKHERRVLAFFHSKLEEEEIKISHCC